jgi:hypothetical protein
MKAIGSLILIFPFQNQNMWFSNFEYLKNYGWLSTKSTTHPTLVLVRLIFF